jgi:hypothetical protein
VDARDDVAPGGTQLFQRAVEEAADLMIGARPRGLPLGQSVDAAGDPDRQLHADNVVEHPQIVGVGQIQIEFFAGFPFRRLADAGILGINAAPGKGDIPRPGVIGVGGPFDVEDFRPTGAGPEDECHRRMTVRGLRRQQRRSGVECLAEAHQLVGPGGWKRLGHRLVSRVEVRVAGRGGESVRSG